MPSILIPTLHLNGSAPSVLEEQAREACYALREATVKLGDMGPNARDYYPQGEGAFPQASRAHGDRLARLRAIYDEVEEIYQGIEEAIHARDARKAR